MSERLNLGQFFTPNWVAEALVERYYPRLCIFDAVVEPSCGEGAFLRALPDSVPACGVEIDPELAARARRNTGRPVHVGDFRAIDVPLRPTLVLGNPPFKTSIISGFIDRAWELLPDEGNLGFILPAFALQYASTIDRLSSRWHLEQDMLPREIFPRLRHPLCFARLTKGPRRGLVGFALYHEMHAVNRLQKRYRALLDQGERSHWAAVTRAAVEALGGCADLPSIYREVEGNRPTSNRFWHAKVRQQLQRFGRRVGPGVWSIKTEVASS